jgi:hypothetical protein
LDRYFEFVLYRVRHHWLDGDKSKCSAVGVDIKYNQLRELEPAGWDRAAAPFLLSYLKARGAVLIHARRRNIIRCALSSLIAPEKDIWPDNAETVESRFAIDVEQCMQKAEALLKSRDFFLEAVQRYPLIDYCYEDLASEADDAGPLRSIAQALAVPFSFTFKGSPRPADIPSAQLLSNPELLSEALKQSSFAPYCHDL